MPSFFRTALLLASLTPGTHAAENTSVAMGGAVLVPLPRDAGQVVIGNPAVADVTLQSPRSLVLFGKYPGGTSLIVTDRAGQTILRSSVQVTAADADGVTIRYGTGKGWTPGGTLASAACGPERCAPAIALAAPPGASAASPAAPAAPAPLQQQH